MLGLPAVLWTTGHIFKGDEKKVATGWEHTPATFFFIFILVVVVFKSGRAKSCEKFGLVCVYTSVEKNVEACIYSRGS